MRLKTLEINGFKSFAQKSVLEFETPIVCIVGPNGSGKSNVVEAFRYVLGEQSMKSMRGRSGTDLIFKGSKSLSKGSRAMVKIYFNNSDKVFKFTNDNGEDVDLNYDIVNISREVYSDSLNKYILNGVDVRLKDIHQLLASVNIGSSGHHIISQGEADRILNANGRERREMVEDALGLKVYQYKIKESSRKLERTSENMKEVGMLRRENAPHLNFLKKQVEKFEKAREMQMELELLYRQYLRRESRYLEEEKSKLDVDKNKITSDLEIVIQKISSTEDEKFTEGSAKIDELRINEKKINEVRSIKNDMERKLGRIEGMLEMEEQREMQVPEAVVMSEVEIKSILCEVNSSIEEAILKESMSEIRPILERIKIILNRFNKSKEIKDHFNDSLQLQKSRQEILIEMDKIENEEMKISEFIFNLKKEIDEEIKMLRDLEREKFTWKVRHQELSSALELLHIKETNLKNRGENFENEIREGAVLVGSAVLSYKNYEINEINEENEEELKRKIERIKIKLEDAGLGNSAEITKEFNETRERDLFLEKELEDLARSIGSLEKMIVDLKEKIDIEFQQGIRKINVEFQEFFSLMFGGGSASLSIVTPKKKKRKDDEDDEIGESMDINASLDQEENILQPGIEINIALPHKKVKELQALSGGERSLTSIAILFAMSQVNPPPFLVLDETDAALDEANSRKYGDMLEKLSKHSQLVVVTHNRETMSRAGVLYGITVGADGASKLLSIKFEEATAIAK